MIRASTVMGLFAAAVGTAAFAAPAAEGEKIYETACIACHGANGKGSLPGMPDFTKKGGVLAQSDEVLLKHVTEGFQSPGSPMPMPPKGGNPSLTEQQLRAAILYLRERFGGR